MNLRLRLISLLVLVGLAAAAHATEGIDLERYRGRVVVLDFWASWCAPCRQSFPWLNEMQAKYGPQGLVVIGINVDRERTEADKFLRAVPAKFELAFDPTGALAARYDIPGMPSSFVIDRTGRVVAKHIGFRASERDEREAEIAQWVAARP
jgi:thiol-disulfide isomerase/thioredoxin